MADTRTTGPGVEIIVVIAVVAAVAMILFFWLDTGDSGGPGSQLPAVQAKGLQWSIDEVQKAGFSAIESHDALGRDRRWRDDREWKVCFQKPAAGSHPATTKVELGVVQTVETCPISDQAVVDPAGDTMPDLRNRTAYIARETLGHDASIRFLDRSDGDEVSSGLGDWRVCAQSPLAGRRFDGLPVVLRVVDYGSRC